MVSAASSLPQFPVTVRRQGGRSLAQVAATVASDSEFQFRAAKFALEVHQRGNSVVGTMATWLMNKAYSGADGNGIVRFLALLEDRGYVTIVWNSPRKLQLSRLTLLPKAGDVLLKDHKCAPGGPCSPIEAPPPGIVGAEATDEAPTHSEETP